MMFLFDDDDDVVVVIILLIWSVSTNVYLVFCW